MATLTVRNIPDDAKLRFRQVAAAHGRSMEEHLRHLIVSAARDASDTAVRETAATFRHAPTGARAESRARIERLIALGRGLDTFELPEREVGTIRDLDLP